MSTQEKDVIKTVKVQTAKRQKPPVTSRAYRGTSTVDPNATGFNLYDLALIKQDIINMFHIRQGEKLENPEFGTIVWDALYEPLTEDLKEAIAENVTESNVSWALYLWEGATRNWKCARFTWEQLGCGHPSILSKK